MNRNKNSSMIRTVPVLAALVFLAASCGSGTPDKLPADVVNISATADSSNLGAEKMPRIAFEEVTHDFGKLTEGEQVEYHFRFINTGNAGLLITHAVGSCGCTVPEYPKQLIKPGESGLLKVKFDSKGKTGTFDKKVTVTCNTEPRETVLTVTGEVIPSN